MAATDVLKEREEGVVLDQFKRNLDHILIDNTKPGPEITIGKLLLRFRSKIPVRALALLITGENRLEGMQNYIRKALVEGQDEAFEALLDNIDIEGLAEILSVLGEAYTAFQEKS